MSSRALRRHHQERLRKRRFKELKDIRDDVNHQNHKEVGKYLQAPKVCSEGCCGNPRRWWGQKTRQEIRAEEMYK